MKNYIVFDLEWNQSANGKERSVPHFPFEIIEIGAVKLNENFQMTGEFHRLVRPAGVHPDASCHLRGDPYEYEGTAKQRGTFPGCRNRISCLVRRGCRVLHLGQHGSS